jgi:cellulose synthase operon protein C
MSRLGRLALALGLLIVSPWAAPAHAGFNFDWMGKVELDAADLTSDDDKKRLAAIQSLAQYDSALTAPYLLPALRDPQRPVRLEAARVLGRGAVADVVPTMVEWLADPLGDVRGVAAEVLGDVGGDDATAALIRTLGDDDAAVRLKAVVALGKIGQRGNPAVVVPLISRLEDDKSDVRRKTVEQLELLKDKRAVIPLVSVFGDMNPDVKKAAIRAVGQLGDPAAVSALLRLVNESDKDVRALAVSALGTIGAPEATDTLIDLLPAADDQLRPKVAFAIGQIAARPGSGDAAKRAVRALVEALADPGQRGQAREALDIAGKAAVPALIDHLDGKLTGDPVTAVDLLQIAKDPRATPALIAELDRGRVPVPVVLAALGATGDPRALVPVLGTLSAKEPAVRLAAMNALRPLVGQDARAADVLIERLADDDLEVRILAAEYLGLTHARAAIDKLAGLTQAGSPPRLRLAAIDALGEIGDPRGAPALIALLREGPAELHRAAVDALSYAGDEHSAEPLLALARDDRGATRHHLVRALGAVLRDRKGDADDAIQLMRRLADGATTKVSLAAISGLAAAGATDAAPLLTDLLDKSGSDRRRASAQALGDLGVVDAVPALYAALSAKDDRVVTDAVWALGQIAATSPEGLAAVTRKDQLAQLFHAAKRGGWGASVSATGALARIALVSPEAVAPHRAEATALLHHRSRLVRINAAKLVAALERGAAAPAAATIAALVSIVDDDPSTGARLAAVRALAAIAAGKPAKLGTAAIAALDATAATARNPELAAAAVAAKKSAPAEDPPATQWRLWYVVDPADDDRPARQEAFFVIGGDHLVRAMYTDARGELATEHFSPGDAEVVLPATKEAEL